MTYEKQVDRAHYEGKAYRSSEHWASYWHQLALVRATGAKTLLEVGVGEGVVARELRKSDVEVTTVDIAEDLHPDVVGSVTALPFPDKHFDAVLAAEILEHIIFDDVASALKEIARVSRRYAVISLPHPGYIFSVGYKVPLLPRIDLFAQLPFFWKEHHFNGEHYWELGKKSYPVSRFVELAAAAGFELVASEKYPDDLAHRFFVFKTQ